MLQSFINQNGNQVIRTSGKVLSIGETLTNSNGTMYRPATVEVTIKGVKQNITAVVWQTVVEKYSVNIGETYIVDMEKSSDGRIYNRLTHFRAIENINVEDFDSLFSDATPKSSVTAATSKVDGNEIF